MTYTEQLKDEHKGVKFMLRIMDRICDRFMTGEQVNPEHLKKIVDFLKVFADTCHHAKEEELLFPAMVLAGIPKEGGPIGVMLTEHSQGRAHVKALGEAVVDFKNGISRIGSNNRIGVLSYDQTNIFYRPILHGDFSPHSH